VTMLFLRNFSVSICSPEDDDSTFSYKSARRHNAHNVVVFTAVRT
jgi:hypothetical protein